MCGQNQDKRAGNEFSFLLILFKGNYLACTYTRGENAKERKEHGREGKTNFGHKGKLF